MTNTVKHTISIKLNLKCCTVFQIYLHFFFFFLDFLLLSKRYGLSFLNNKCTVLQNILWYTMYALKHILHLPSMPKL